MASRQGAPDRERLPHPRLGPRALQPSCPRGAGRRITARPEPRSVHLIAAEPPTPPHRHDPTTLRTPSPPALRERAPTPPHATRSHAHPQTSPLQRDLQNHDPRRPSTLRLDMRAFNAAPASRGSSPARPPSSAWSAPSWPTPTTSGRSTTAATSPKPPWHSWRPPNPTEILNPPRSPAAREHEDSVLKPTTPRGAVSASLLAAVVGLLRRCGYLLRSLSCAEGAAARGRAAPRRVGVAWRPD